MPTWPATPPTHVERSESAFTLQERTKGHTLADQHLGCLNEQVTRRRSRNVVDAECRGCGREALPGDLFAIARGSGDSPQAVKRTEARQGLCLASASAANVTVTHCAFARTIASTFHEMSMTPNARCRALLCLLMIACAPRPVMMQTGARHGRASTVRTHLGYPCPGLGINHRAGAPIGARPLCAARRSPR